MEKLRRRDFLRVSALTAVGVAAAACAKTPTEAPKTVEATKPAAATATPKPAEPTATTVATAPKGNEAPMLADLVTAGKLPPVAERSPTESLVVPVVEEIGQYGGTWHRLANSPGDANLITSRLSYENFIRFNG